MDKLASTGGHQGQFLNVQRNTRLGHESNFACNTCMWPCWRSQIELAAPLRDILCAAWPRQKHEVALAWQHVQGCAHGLLYRPSFEL